MLQVRTIHWALGLTIAVLVTVAAHPAHAVLTIVGDDFSVPTPSGSASTGSFELYLTDDTGGPVSLGNYQLRIGLTGPNAGTDVKIIGGGQTSAAGSHPPAVIPPILATDVQIVEDAAYFLATENTFVGDPPEQAPPFDVADQAGLARIDFEVQPGASGAYTFEILTTSVTADTALVDGADFVTPLTFGTSSPVLTLTSFLLGDADGSGVVNNLDISPFIIALTLGGNTSNQQDINNYTAQVPGGCFQCTDTDQSQEVNNIDISPFIGILAGGSSAGSTSAVPEPASLALMAAAAVLLVRGRR